MTTARSHIKTLTWQTWMGQWAELLLSGMPALDSLRLSGELQTEHHHGRLLFERLQNTAKYLESGQNLQTAFRASFGALPSAIEVALLCGQASGDLGTALQDQLQRWRVTREASLALGRSLIYPGVVLALALACWVFLHQVSSPHLNSITTPAASAPGTADFLLWLGAALLGASMWVRIKRPAHKKGIQFSMPHKAWIASNFYHVIACELNSGLDLMHCLRHRTLPLNAWAGRINPHRQLLDGLNLLMANIQRNLRQGMGLGQAMEKANAPYFLIRQSHLAEQTGNLAYCFFLGAKVYEMQAKTAQQRLQAILPPVALGLAALTLAMAYHFTLAPLYSNLTGLS